RLSSKLTIVADWNGDRDQAAVPDSAPFIEGRTISGEDDVAVEHQTAYTRLVDLFRLARRKADHVAVLLHDGTRHAMRQREPRVLGEVPRLAVHRNHDLGPHPLV